MTSIITWAEGVISLAEPPIVSECSVLGSAVGSGLLLFGSPSRTTDVLNSLSKKMLGGLHRVLRRCMPGHLPPDYFPGLYAEIRALRTELTFLGRRCDKLPFLILGIEVSIYLG